MKSNSVLAGMAAGMVSLLGDLKNSLTVAFPRDERAAEKTRAKRAELTTAWRLYRPAPLKFRHNGEGPRPAESYRAARRNARRRSKAA